MHSVTRKLVQMKLVAGAGGGKKLAKLLIRPEDPGNETRSNA